MNFIIVHNVFLLLVIIVIKAIQPDCDKIKGSSVLLLETPLTQKQVHFPINTRTTSYANFKNLLHIRGNQTIKIPLHWWRIWCPVEGEERQILDRR